MKDKEEIIRNKLEYLFGILEPDKITNFLDGMFEAWLPDCSMLPVYIQERHIAKRMLSEIVEDLYNNYNINKICN